MYDQKTCCYNLVINSTNILIKTTKQLVVLSNILITKILFGQISTNTGWFNQCVWVCTPDKPRIMSQGLLMKSAFPIRIFWFIYSFHNFWDRQFHRPRKLTNLKRPRGSINFIPVISFIRVRFLFSAFLFCNYPQIKCKRDRNSRLIFASTTDQD